MKNDPPTEATCLRVSLSSEKNVELGRQVVNKVPLAMHSEKIWYEDIYRDSNFLTNQSITLCVSDEMEKPLISRQPLKHQQISSWRIVNLLQISLSCDDLMKRESILLSPP